MKKILSLCTAIILSVSLLAGCGETASKDNTNNKSNSQSTTTTAKDDGNEENDTAGEKSEQNPAPSAKNFESISLFSDKFEKVANQLDEGTESIDNMAILGELLALNVLQTVTINVSLDQAMQGSPDIWNTGKLEMPNGAGQYESVCEKNGGVYTYTYTSYYENRTEISTLIYDTDKMTVSYTRGGEGNVIDKIVVQEYIDENGAFYISYSKLLIATGQITQIVIFGDDKNANYAFSAESSGDEPTLVVDIIANPPTSWDNMIDGFAYKSMFTYDGNTPNYQTK